MHLRVLAAMYLCVCAPVHLSVHASMCVQHTSLNVTAQQHHRQLHNAKAYTLGDATQARVQQRRQDARALPHILALLNISHT